MKNKGKKTMKNKWHVVVIEDAIDGYKIYKRIAPYEPYPTEKAAVDAIHKKFEEVGNTTLSLGVMKVTRTFHKVPQPYIIYEE